MSQPTTGPSRNNPAQSTKIPSPVKVSYSVKGRGVLEAYDMEKQEKQDFDTTNAMMTLAVRFFLYGYNEATGTGYRSDEYARKSDTVSVWSRTGSQSNKVTEGTPQSLDALKKDLQLTTGCVVYAYDTQTKEIVKFDMTGTARGLFMDFQQKSGQFPSFSISFRETTKEDRGAAREKAKRTVTMPDFVPVFHDETEGCAQFYQEAKDACTELDLFFLARLEAKTGTTSTATTAATTSMTQTAAAPNGNAGDDLPF